MSHETHSTQPRRIDHVALAVPDLDAACDRFRKLFNRPVSEPEILKDHGVRIAWLELDNCKIELMEPYGEDSPISTFLIKNPRGGLHHVCCNFDNLSKALIHMHDNGIRHTPKRCGAHAHQVSFLHPKDMYGMLFEMQEDEPPSS